MKARFKLVGLTKPNTAAIQHTPQEKIDCSTDLPKDRFDALFDYFKLCGWTGNEVAVIKCDGVVETNGADYPVNPILVDVIL